jgi:predicted DNA-binding protein with PD1-like motif
VKYFALGSTYVIRLDRGDKIVGSLEALAERDRIGCGWFSGLGAVSEAEIAHFDPASSAYSSVRIQEPCEIASLHGNLTLKDGRPYVHAHIVLGDRSFNARGGHLREAVVSATVELVLTTFQEDIGRRKDAATGLEVLDLKPEGS